MKFMPTAPVFLLLLFFETHTYAINISSSPGANSEGVIQVQLNKTVTLVCNSGGSSEADEELVWLRNGAMVSLKEENKKVRSDLCVSPVIHEDNDATFTCHLRKNASERTSVTLNVTYPPQLSGSEEVMVEKGAQLLLRCDTWANPPILSVAWTLNGSIVDLLVGGFVLTSDGFTSQLQVSSVDPSLHKGTYRCTADYPITGNYNKVFHITVTEKTMKFPLMPMIAGLVVVFFTSLFAIVSRWKKITKRDKDFRVVRIKV
ncbi:transmembrane and immunoglobulin domain-containing protein 1 [Xenentodon cancila]